MDRRRDQVLRELAKLRETMDVYERARRQYAAARRKPEEALDRKEAAHQQIDEALDRINDIAPAVLGQDDIVPGVVRCDLLRQVGQPAVRVQPAGGVEIGLGDGTVHRFGPGHVNLAEDLTGQGHTTRVVGDQPRVTAVIPLS